MNLLLLLFFVCYTNSMICVKTFDYESGYNIKYKWLDAKDYKMDEKINHWIKEHSVHLLSCTYHYYKDFKSSIIMYESNHDCY